MRSLAAAAVASWAAPVLAATPHVQASLVAESESVQPGTPLVVAVRLQMEEGWHTYWKNPADAGLPTRVAWRLAEGLTAGPLQWPRPGRFGAPPVVSYGYHGDLLLPVSIDVSKALRPGTTVELAGRVSWLECKEACLPGKADVSLVLPVRAEAPRPSAAAPRLAEARRLVPVAADGWRVSARRTPAGFTLTFREPKGAPVRDAYFYAADPQVLDHAAPQPLGRAGSAQALRLSRDPNAAKAPERLRGVLVARVGEDTMALEIDTPTAAAGAAQ
jgi:thiol:disulfide interchange protein DsbD